MPMYPPPPVVVDGQNITVNQFIQSPARVQRAIEDLSRQRFIADVIFSAGPEATGGAVVYDQVTATDSFLSRDVQAIEPGAEFPILDDTDPSPAVALARKWGGELILTDEQVRRDRRDVLNRRMVRLRNTIVKKVDTYAMAVLEASPKLTMVASGDWTTAATDIIKDLVQAKLLSEGLDLGYELDTVLLNPAQGADLLGDKDIRDALPREEAAPIIRTGQLGTLLGLTFVQTNRVAAGTVWLVQRGIVGGISNEVPLYARPIPDPRRERTILHGARVPVAYVTDPKAAVKITGA